MGHKKSAEGIVPLCSYCLKGRPELVKPEQSCNAHGGEVVEMTKALDNYKERISLTVNDNRRMIGGTGEVQQTEIDFTKALNKDEPLTEYLMEKISNPRNLNHALKKVRANKGSSGVDGMTVKELGGYVGEHLKQLVDSLLDGSYEPQEVLAVEIPKPNGGVRRLGIPTVVDRLIQQSIVQVLEPILEPTFSDSSYGFRPNRSGHTALKKSQEYVRKGYDVVVDIDLEKFFDRVNHDVLMSRLARRVKDKRLLRIVRRFLEAGMMRQGVCVERYEGMPQGGNLSPLLSNLLLDELDKELEKRGHKFCRYADDCNIYVRSQRAGERVMSSIRKFLEEKLRLKVNENKSKVAKAHECKFLGYTLQDDGKLTLAKETLKRFRDKVRGITKRNRGRSLGQIVTELNRLLLGWVGYFRLTEWQTQLRDLDGWIRRKLRCYRIKQRKRKKSIAKYLMKLGVGADSALATASSSKGWWRLSKTPALHQAMSKVWFENIGLVNLEKRSKLLNA